MIAACYTSHTHSVEHKLRKAFLHDCLTHTSQCIKVPVANHFLPNGLSGRAVPTHTACCCVFPIRLVRVLAIHATPDPALCLVSHWTRTNATTSNPVHLNVRSSVCFPSQALAEIAALTLVLAVCAFTRLRAIPRRVIVSSLLVTYGCTVRVLTEDCSVR